METRDTSPWCLLVCLFFSPKRNAWFNNNFLIKSRKFPILGMLLIFLGWGLFCFLLFCFMENTYNLKMKNKKVLLSFCIFFAMVNTNMNMFFIQNSIKYCIIGSLCSNNARENNIIRDIELLLKQKSAKQMLDSTREKAGGVKGSIILSMVYDVAMLTTVSSHSFL